MDGNILFDIVDRWNQIVQDYFLSLIGGIKWLVSFLLLGWNSKPDFLRITKGHKHAHAYSARK